MLQDLFPGDLSLQGGLPFLAGPLLPAVCLTGLTPFIPGGAEGLAVLPDLRLDAGNGLVHDGLLQLAFPDNDDKPALSLKLAPGLLIAFFVPGNFGGPELRVGLRDRIVLASIVSVPETAVNEDDGVVFGENDVGGAGEPNIIYLIAQA